MKFSKASNKLSANFLSENRYINYFFKGALSGLILFLAIEGPLKMMKNAFYFTLKAHFVLKIFKFLSSLLCHAEKMA